MANPENPEKKIESNPNLGSENSEKKDLPNPNLPIRPIRPIHFKQLIPRLSKVLASANGNYKANHIAKKVFALLKAYDVSYGDWKYYVMWDENPAKYTRNLIARDDNFNLILLCWPAGSTSPVHDHGGSECYLLVIKGSIVEYFYEKVDPEKSSDPLKLRFSKTHNEGDICFINDDRGLHRIANGSATEPVFTLHCYVPGYKSCNAYMDETSASSVKQCFMAFTSINGKKVTH